MNRIDRYILSQFFLFFFGGLIVFVTLFLAIDVMSTMVSYNDVTLTTLLKYYGYLAPEIIYKMIPVSGLLATVFTLSTLNKSHELVALFSLGMGLWRVTLPIILGVIVISGFNFFLSDRILPVFSQSKNDVFLQEIKKKPSLSATIKTGRIWYRSKDKIFYIKTLNPQTRKAQEITLYYFNDNWKLLQMIKAREAWIGLSSFGLGKSPDSDEKALAPSQWKLIDGSVTLFPQDSQFPQTSEFKTKTIPMDEDTQDMLSSANTSEVLSISELSSFIRKNKDAGLDTTRYEVDYHSKWGFAFSALVMCLLGIPFSIGSTRSGGVMLSAGLCLGLVFLYWVFYSSALALGNYGYIPPIMAGWSPNVITSGLAVYFMRKQKK